MNGTPIEHERGAAMTQTITEPEQQTRPPRSAPAFLIHNEGDHVAVAVQDVEPGEREAVYMDSDRAVALRVADPIPLGHKVALVDLPEGAEVTEYGVRIGLTRQPITAGQWVHVHNIRSARWQKSL
jgi:(2R)-sulfolactate sulfo-lyase subunit alpha